MNQDYSFEQLDKSQLPVVMASKGHHLVLAPPGCGKTHILAERVKFAHTLGFSFDDMLCLTFTNRAAREMINRIEQAFKDTDISALQVGNVHHFCSKFLFEENKIASDSSIIDDEEAVSIIADHRNESEEDIIGNYNRYRSYQQIIFFSHLMFQLKHKHDWSLFLHPECLTDDDRTVIKYFCQTQHMDFTEEAIVEIYTHVEAYMEDINSFGLDTSLIMKMKALLEKMYYASCYEKYKIESHLLDFEDLLLFTYEVYRKDPTCKRYKWIQVDEVQDLNGMQLAIIDLLTAPEDPIVMYLGDEQQAIFSFMGAKADVLNTLKIRCKASIHHLMQNHRSPKYLLDIFNIYAEKQLHIDPSLLPITDNEEVAKDDCLRILYSNTIENEVDDTVDLVQSLSESSPTERTAVIVNSNADADKISKKMDLTQVSHFKALARTCLTLPK